MSKKISGRIQVAIIGAGFAGLSAAKRLAKHKDVDVLLLDRNNYHVFQPLLYQVAAAELEAGNIANPLRGLFRKYRNVSVLMAEVTGADLQKKVLFAEGRNIDYDYLVLATGCTINFFGTSGAEEYAFPLKSLETALRIRNHILQCLEQASLMQKNNEAEQSEALTHVIIVGGGPSGVEYAGALAELARTSLARDFPEFPRDRIKITLLEAAEHLLTGFPERLCDYTKSRLERMGVVVRFQAQVTEIREDAVLLADGTILPSATVVWAAGVCGSELAQNMHLETGRSNRVNALPTLQIPTHPDVLVAGDLSLPENMNVPMVAPNAMQQGRHAAENILRLIRNEPPLPFQYHDKGSLAVIGRNAAVAQIGRFALSGFFAWVLWLCVHLGYLVGFHNRLMVVFNWAWDYLFAERSVRLILPRNASRKKTKPIKNE